ncbi:MAG TPA: hypothetical protein VFH45_04725, partial [Acidimicrobiales bacterium]|nr:hypothetical protein [Acidimicrobiales bacterium]
EDVFVPRIKEPGFFLEAHHYERGLAHYSARCYSEVGDQPVVVDATPWYLYPASVPARIAGSIGAGGARIVIVLREPVARAVSMYHDQLGRRREERSLAEVVADELAVDDPEAELAGEAGPGLFRHYVLCGCYAGPVRRYLDTFGAGAVCVLLAEELWGDQEAVRRRLEAFLQVALPPAPQRAANPASRARLGPVESLLSRAEASSSPLRTAVGRAPAVAAGVRRAMEAVARWNQAPTRYDAADPDLRGTLAAWYEPHNRRLESELGRSLSRWR